MYHTKFVVPMHHRYVVIVYVCIHVHHIVLIKSLGIINFDGLSVIIIV